MNRSITWKTCIRIGVTIVLVYLACTYWHSLVSIVGLAFGAAAPLLLGAAIAYVVNILMGFCERNLFPKCKHPLFLKVKRPLSMLLAFVAVVAAIVWMFTTVIPELWRCVEMIVNALPGVLRGLFTWLEEKIHLSSLLADMGFITEGATFDWKKAVDSMLPVLGTGVSGVMGTAISVATSLFSGIVMLFLALVFAVYLLMGKEKLGAQVHRIADTYLGKETSSKVFYVIHTVDEAFHSYIVGQSTEALILGSLCFLGMMVFGFNNALTISVMVGFLALIPIAGAYIAGAAGAVLLMMESPLMALLFVVYLVVLQQFEGNIIFPRVVGSSIGLPGIWVLAAVTVGGGILGILGMLLGVPLAAAIYRLITRDIQAREQGITVFDIPLEEPKRKTLFR